MATPAVTTESDSLRLPITQSPTLTKSPKRISLTDAVDELGRVRASIADLRIREAELTSAIKTRSKKKYVEGRLFNVTISEYTAWRLNTESVKEEMGQAWWLARCAPSLVVKVLVTARRTVLRR